MGVIVVLDSHESVVPTTEACLCAYWNRVFDSVAGNFVRWKTEITPDPTGAFYPGPGTFNIDTSDFVMVATSAVLVTVGGGGGSPDFIKDEFTPTFGQTIFVLSQMPTDFDSIQVYVNGVLYDDVADWTIFGTTLTWLGFTLEVTDKLIVQYV